MSMVLRGITFEGRSFDDFEPVGEASAFPLNHGCLCDCQIECSVPVSVIGPRGREEGRIDMRLELGPPARNGGIEYERVQLTLHIEDERFVSSGQSGWFEDELLLLQEQLDEHIMRICFGCAFSDYSPGGHGLFGDLACFVDDKEAYGEVDSKAALFNLWSSKSASVPETHSCDAFEPREPGAGYRG